MQANCPQCSHRIVIDDARVPDRPFSVKCPKCQTAVRFPGKGAAAAAAPPPAVPAVAAAAAAPPDEAMAGGGEDLARAQMIAQIRREMSLGEQRPGGRALVSVPGGQAGNVALPLTRQGYQVDTSEGAEDNARLLDQGVYDLVVTTRAEAPAGRESMYQRVMRLTPENRRRIVLVLVGDDFKTGDGTQAWSVNADLVVNTRDAGAVDAVLLRTVEERQRLYQAFNDVRRRHEAAVS